MHELSCPSCNAASQYDLSDYLLMCSLCSATFSLRKEDGEKEVYSDHFIIPNGCESGQVKGLVVEWLKRLHHNPSMVRKEYFITEIKGYSIPYWIVSLEAHTAWSGLVRRHSKKPFEIGLGAEYIRESGQFRRNYRWAISARQNIFEHWGFTRLHEPNEAISVEWDGFPLDSTFSRGRIDPNLGVKASKENRIEDLSAYDVREFFDFKFSNSLPVLTIQTPEDEALRRTRDHVNRYHYKLAKLNVDLLIESRSELEIAGVQLIHLPFWTAKYVYQPSSVLKHFRKGKEKHVMIEGYAGGILQGNLPVVRNDKLIINTVVCGFAAMVLFFLGVMWHSSFFLIALFALGIGGASIFTVTKGSKKKAEEEEEELSQPVAQAT